ncbi:hypothetical protein [Streptomyces bauhiniae]|uniref:hypothetical protein n=1 Tax=Streptomyces bauhiniae TaxID=2340725 RepID=UPI0036529C5A
MSAHTPRGPRSALRRTGKSLVPTPGTGRTKVRARDPWPTMGTRPRPAGRGRIPSYVV